MKRIVCLLLICCVLSCSLTGCLGLERLRAPSTDTELTVGDSDRVEESTPAETFDEETTEATEEEKMESATTLPKDKTYRILFVGNSYTYYNDSVPTEFLRMATSLGYDVQVDSVTKGAYTLEQFANVNDPKGREVDEALRTTQYDFVFLQEQSHTPVTNPEKFYGGARALVEKVRACGAEPIFYATWGRRDGNGDIEKFGLVDNKTMTWNLAAAYTKMGRELNVPVAYAGLAFRYLYVNSSIDLYHSDGSHPSPVGTFVAAFTLFSTLFRVRPEQVHCEKSFRLEEWELIKRAVHRAAFEDPQIPEVYSEAYGLKEN